MMLCHLYPFLKCDRAESWVLPRGCVTCIVMEAHNARKDDPAQGDQGLLRVALPPANGLPTYGRMRSAELLRRA
jgi:hypothetical protein